MRKSGAKDKFALTRFAIKKAKQLLKEKDKRALLDSKKLTVYALEELQKQEEESEREEESQEDESK